MIVGDIILAVAKAGISANDANKRRKFDQAMESMSAAEQKALSEKLAKEQSQVMQTKILMDAIDKEQQRKNMTLYIGAGLTVVILLTVIIAISRK